jgi:DNA-binding NtrC family response regulator
MASLTAPILLVDDDEAILRSSAQVFEEAVQYPCISATTAEACLDIVARQDVSLVMLDLGLPDLPGEEVLASLRRDHPEVPVIIVTGLADIDSAVRCMGSGAYDYVVKGADPGRLVNSVRRALESREKDLKIASFRESLLATNLKRPECFSDLITANDHMRALFRFIEAVAASEEPILLQGETGTGKELFARAIHKASEARGPFVATNLGGLDDLLISDTLFGHVRGAYTGADESRKGLIFQASGGTLFLDEIGDLSPQSQVKLLRFLENREYFPLGTDIPRRSEARIVAATNQDLESRADQGRFRRDLLYRLSTYRIHIPPLKDRPEDLPLLCEHFLKSIANGGESLTLTQGALAALGRYSFPGNVRELRGLLLKAKAVCAGQAIDRSVMEGLLGASPKSFQVTSAAAPAASISPAGLGTQDVAPAAPSTAPELPTIQEAIEDLIDRALKRTQGHQGMAAKLLGISPQALSQRLKHRGSEP